MLHTRLLCATTLVFGLAAFLSFQAQAQTQTTRILPLGDSITAGVDGQCSYRRALSQRLITAGRSDVQFVGPRQAPNGDPAACRATNTDHAGYAGLRADQFTDSLIGELMADYSPERVLVHLGSNDLFQGQSVQSTVDDIDRIITSILASRPTATVLLANVIPYNGGQNPSDEPPLPGELSAALGALAQRRIVEGDALRLVDVRSGFDPLALTIDGVHPNDAGEELIATRFHQALEGIDCCSTGNENLPALQLVEAQWAQIGLPADPGSNDTVADIFDELPATGYASSWAVFAAETAANAAVTYQQLALNSRMSTDRGYWVIQMVSPNVTVRMPATSRLVSLFPDSACGTSADCASVPLQGHPERFQWNLIGYPLTSVTRFDASRFSGSSGACTTGCSPTDAESNGFVHDVLWHYDPQLDGGYREIRGTATLQAWDGLWAAVLPGANGTEPVWQVAP